MTRAAAAVALASLAVAVAVAAPRAHAQTPEDNARRLRVYHERIASESRRLAPRTSLAALISPVFALAAERSRAAGVPSAADENRAAILALTLYVNGWSPAMFSAEAKEWDPPVPREVVLRGRRDLAQHFIVSAVIAAAAGSPVAAAAGLYKELSDARDGSGFSFSDLAADRAGERFGTFATQSDASARELQSRLTPGVAEPDFMPDVSGLVDNLSEAEFKSQFGAVGSPAYNDVMNDIARRVQTLPLFR